MRVDATISDDDREWRRIMAALGDASGEVSIGIQQTEGASIADVRNEAGNVEPSSSGVTVFDKAVRNEFGDGVPERSFLRSTFDEKAATVWAEWGREQLGEVVDGKRDLGQALARVGERAKADVQTKIVEGPFVPNAPETVKRKRSSRPLIDTGQLRQAIRYLVRVARGKGSGGGAS